MQDLESLFDAPGVWAILLILGLFGYMFNVVLVAVERRVLRWQVGRGGGL